MEIGHKLKQNPVEYAGINSPMSEAKYKDAAGKEVVYEPSATQLMGLST